jgi:hypothetical protein
MRRDFVSGMLDAGRRQNRQNRPAKRPICSALLPEAIFDGD